MPKKIYILFQIVALILCTSNLLGKQYYIISGWVLDKNNQRGIENARVKIDKSGSHRSLYTKTDKNGYFQFIHLYAGNYTIDGFCLLNSLPPGYIAENKSLLETEFVLSGDKDLLDQKISVIYGATISGRIFKDDEMTPISDVLIETAHYPFILNNRYIHQKKVVKSGEDGRFRIQGLSHNVNKLILVIRCPDMCSIYETVVIQKGMEIERDFICKSNSKTKISGTLYDRNTKFPIADATIEIMQQDNYCTSSGCLGYATTDRNGNFVFYGLAKCGYRLIADKDGKSLDLHDNSFFRIENNETKLGAIFASIPK